MILTTILKYSKIFYHTPYGLGQDQSVGLTQTICTITILFDIDLIHAITRCDAQDDPRKPSSSNTKSSSSRVVRALQSYGEKNSKCV